MATEYTILRQDSRKSRTDEDEIFLQLEIATDTDVFQKAVWLTQSDVAAIIADPTAIDVIATRIASRAVLARPKQLEDEAKAHDLEIARLNLETAQEQAKVL